MTSLRSRWTTLALGGLAVAVAGSTARSDGMVKVADGMVKVADGLVKVADRCTAAYGANYVDLGNGTCGLVSRRIEGPSNGWSGNNAALRSDGVGMMPGAGNARHLRIQVDPDFR